MSLQFDQLAFSSLPPRDWHKIETPIGEEEDEPLVTAAARMQFETSNGGSTLNVELFGNGWVTSDENTSPTLSQKGVNILLFVPGVCESAETWTVQHIARLCRDTGWMLAVLELPGHGLSSGPRAVLQPTGRTGLSRLVDIVTETADNVFNHLLQKVSKHENCTMKMALSGSSLGGVLAAYATPKVSQMIQDGTYQKQSSSHPCQIQLVGNILLSPAVGVAQAAIPPPMIVSALSCLAFVAPSASFLTPTEDPSHYNCPSWTQRNFSGHWPLGTSKLLLDITSVIVPDDMKKTIEVVPSTSSSPFCVQDCTIQSFVITGTKDPVVPLQSVREFVNAINASEGSVATLVEISKGDHGLLAGPKGKVVDLVTEHFKTALLTLANRS
ncbi:serine aminopeptidase, S33 [Nitzschia inconspicua]|uniref:Serine aminopeptidase, S33 n=1 Tax=Nitzschia inconspicua TaxID=303405 RepID=A0A9K3PTW2_9STRA|nr:serine aminopeptidase, S33 [Nitzschia inconspicua]